MTDTLTRHAPKMLAVLRIMAALLFMAHGMQKLLGWPPSEMDFVAFLGWKAYVAGTIEIVGGVLVLIGLFTRPAAFVMSGLMAFAYFMAHAPQNFFPANNGGDASILFCFLFLYLVFSGPGAWALDNARGGALEPQRT